ncbi:gamma-glutamylcyclotransferase family protein [Luteolibacter luteus]|uniref:Gamma-glutamylcyclotransferase AIG2-like domain-containing protein n=1 Tax=Luteolibacter luteus TaxID=2728835 RepID=A0A858RDY6_9BACT|nr:gamma-glutamylcyclotransferase [Luteolibacter luteus]QJE95296.1 hypothetical protein HHL09_05725 [Luteolibacter luteus]
MLSDDPGTELVFLYGHQCRDGMMASKLDRAVQVGLGTARGSLLSVAGLPVMVSGDGLGKVRGDVYRVNRKLLDELDEIMAEAARIVGNGNCRRKRITVIEVRYDRPPMEVWVWQWEDLEGPQELISSGDWVDRQATPWFTFIALTCLLTCTLIPGVISTAAAPSVPGFAALWVSLVILALLAPLAGLAAVYIARRRTERLSGFLMVIEVGLLLVLVLVLLQVGSLVFQMFH